MKRDEEVGLEKEGITGTDQLKEKDITEENEVTVEHSSETVTEARRREHSLIRMVCLLTTQFKLASKMEVGSHAMTRPSTRL